MSCKEALKLIHEALDGTAAEDAPARLREHLHACADCARTHEALTRQEALLREADPDEPEAAYFDALARSIASDVRKRERRPVLAPSWAFSSALAAACLLIGLGAGHVALPTTLTRTQTVVQRVTVPGPVREVPVEKVVVREVRVPVEVVRTRTVVQRAPSRPAPTLVAETPATTVSPTLALVPVATRPTVRPTPDLGLAARAAGHDDSYGYAATFASGSTARVSSSDLRLIASRLRSDMGSVDSALGTSTLAVTLVSDMGRAESEMDRSLRAAPATPAASEGTR